MPNMCYNHPDQEATGICVNCGKMICSQCDVVIQDKRYCNHCVEHLFRVDVDTRDIAQKKPVSAATVKAVSSAVASVETVANTSGQGGTAVIPSEISGWNWGAFLMNWIWGIGNGVWIALLTFILGPIMALILGIKGNEWAWRNKKWTSVKHFRKTQRRWTWAGVGFNCISILLVVVVLVINMPSGSDSKANVTRGVEPPITAMNQVAPNNFDMTAEVMDQIATAEKETVIARDGMKLVIPAGAVSGDTMVIVKKFSEPPPVTYLEEAASLPQTVGVSKVYDFGPDGTKFNTPVQISIPYDKTALPADADEKNISLAYFDGKNWITIGGYVDTGNHTVSIRTMDFPGIPFVAVFVGALIIGEAVYLYPTAKSYWEAQEIWGDAYKYVTPHDPVVGEYASKARIWDGTNQVPLQDPQNPNQINPRALELIQTQLSTGGKPMLRFEMSGSLQQSDYYDPYQYHEWLKPADYFTGGMKGSCIDTANAYCSIFRALGLPSKCINGYLKNGGRHEWVEVLIGNRAYFIDNLDQFQLMDDAENTYIRRTYDIFWQQHQWDENGQRKYVNRWWKSEPNYKEPVEDTVLTAHVDNPVLKPGTLTILSVAVNPPQVTRITVDGISKSYSTDNTGFISIDYGIPGDAKPGERKITVRAPDLDLYTNIDVTVAGILLSVKTKQVQPNSTLTADVTVYPREPAQLEADVDGKKYSRTTDSSGGTTFKFAIPVDAKPGQHIVVILAPKLGLTAEDSFIVAGPGAIHILSTPTGADIWIDGSKMSLQTPRTFYDIAAGDHTVTIKISGYQDYSKTLNVAPGATAEVSANLQILPSSTGNLHIVSDQSDATIVIDGITQDVKTPASFNNVTVGSHRVTVKKAGFQDYSETVTVEPSQVREIWAPLQPLQSAKGSLTIGSIPEGADIYLNNQQQDYQTNYSFIDVEAGTYTVSLKKTGYKDYSATAIVAAGKLTELWARLEAVESTPVPSPTPIPPSLDGTYSGTWIQDGDTVFARITIQGNTYTAVLEGSRFGSFQGAGSFNQAGYIDNGELKGFCTVNNVPQVPTDIGFNGTFDGNTLRFYGRKYAGGQALTVSGTLTKNQ